MITRYLLPAAAAGALALGGCASNYGVEGAAAGGLGGALIGGGTGAVIGAAAGAAVGSLVKKDGRCYRVSRNGREYEVRC
jgi:outer membrane lipoprotein SlyB